MKTLVFDIETYGGLKAHMSEVSVFGYKWLGHGDVKILTGRNFPKEFKKDFTNDRPLLVALSKVWNESNAVIAHYGERFDRRFLNSRIEKHGLPPLKPVILIDTWRISKDNLALPGNSLNTLLKFFNCPFQKVDLTYEEWRRVMVGDIKALKKLEDHCKNDVLGLEWIFDQHLGKYTNKLPNINLVNEESVCPSCGSNSLVKRGFHYNQTSVWRRYSCTSCLRWSMGPNKDGGIIR